MKSLRNQKAP